jgi:hypothetical protein
MRANEGILANEGAPKYKDKASKRKCVRLNFVFFKNQTRIAKTNTILKRKVHLGFQMQAFRKKAAGL